MEAAELYRQRLASYTRLTLNSRFVRLRGQEENPLHYLNAPSGNKTALREHQHDSAAGRPRPASTAEDKQVVGGKVVYEPPDDPG